ncbi:MAG TPA: hypothetical protein VF802_04470 [Candidatus Limnocylindrales bacterium]
MAIHHGVLRGPGYHLRRQATCFRCGSEDRVIEDDGVPICLVCVFAWGSYAAMVSAPSARPEVAVETKPHRDPTVTALLHWSHRVPVADCPLCTARL